jgi:hypothetical protein
MLAVAEVHYNLYTLYDLWRREEMYTQLGGEGNLLEDQEGDGRITLDGA